jgi:hypothetical protein
MDKFRIVKPRQDRNDSEKTYWDPIGTLFMTEDKDGNPKLFGQIFAIGDVQVLFDKPKTGDNPY